MFENDILVGDIFAQGILTFGLYYEDPGSGTGTSPGDVTGRGGFDRGVGGPGSSYGQGNPVRVIQTVRA
jgi:hypothetical protein